MIDPHKPKYFPLYWNIAQAAAEQSPAQRMKVGAALVTPTGMISIGWNAMPAGFDNNCETWEEVDDPYGLEDATHQLVTKPEVVHAERNAIDKMTRQGVSTHGSILFVTCAPCFECAKALHSLGLKAIYYSQTYRSDAGLRFLESCGVTCEHRSKSPEFSKTRR